MKKRQKHRAAHILKWIQKNKRPLLLRAAVLLAGILLIVGIVFIVRAIRNRSAESKKAEEASSAQTNEALSSEWESVTYTNPAASYKSASFTANGSFMTYEDERYTSVQGIDVSSYSGEIDWEKVKNAGIRFAFIRLGYRGYTEGGIMLDSTYETNMAGCAAAEIPVGVYFYSQAVSEEEAREEAAFCIEHLEGQEISLPVIYDPEDAPSGSARTTGLSGEQITANALAFIDAIGQAGYTAGIYANREWEKNVLDMTQFQNTIVWFAGFTAYPQSSYHFEFWQYSHEGHVDGFAGDVEVDMDIRFVPKGSAAAG